MTSTLLFIICVTLIPTTLALLFKPKTRRLGYAAAAVTVAFILFTAGYAVGKEMARRDNARETSSVLDLVQQPA